MEATKATLNGSNKKTPRPLALGTTSVHRNCLCILAFLQSVRRLSNAWSILNRIAHLQTGWTEIS